MMGIHRYLQQHNVRLNTSSRKCSAKENASKPGNNNRIGSKRNARSIHKPSKEESNSLVSPKNTSKI